MATVSSSKSAQAVMDYLGKQFPSLADKDLEPALEMVIKFYDEHKLLLAGKLLEQIEDAISESSGDTVTKSLKARIGKRGEYGDKIADLRSSFTRATESMTNFNKNSGWTFSQEMFGSKTWFKTHGGSTVEVLTEATYEGVDIVNFIATMRAFENMKTVLPFATGSKVLKRINRSEEVVWMHMPMPMMNRDIVMHQRMVDSLHLGSFLVLNQSVDRYPGMSIPPPKGLLIERINCHHWDMLLEPLGPKKITVRMLTKKDMKTVMPASVIQFFTRKMAGMALTMMHRASMKTSEKPSRSKYSASMADDPETYQEWLGPIISDHASVAADHKKARFVTLPPFDEGRALLGMSGGGRQSRSSSRSRSKSSTPRRSNSNSSSRRRSSSNSSANTRGLSRSNSSNSNSSRSNSSNSSSSKSSSSKPKGGAFEQDVTSSSTEDADADFDGDGDSAQSGRSPKVNTDGHFVCKITSRVTYGNVCFYNVVVTANGEERSVMRRYSDFKELQSSLVAAGMYLAVPFPPKTTCSNFFSPSERTLTDRQIALGSFLKDVLRTEENIQQTALREFLQLDSFRTGSLTTHSG